MSAIDEIIRAALVRLEERQRVIALDLEERMRLVTETGQTSAAAAYAIAFGDMSRAISVEIRTLRIALIGEERVKQIEEARRSK